ncbi:MGMT family protein [Acinetobacter junii]|uniref:MGMT family protein n=1 Tax=Acinetobacter junii TaxID=40215 RepID=UPI0027E4B36D|nr:MGMT family protein [Acinetobacter junii]
MLLLDPIIFRGDYQRSHLPWHRVINSQGKVSTINLNEQGENRQLKLLKNEGVLLENHKIKLKDYQWIF